MIVSGMGMRKVVQVTIVAFVTLYAKSFSLGHGLDGDDLGKIVVANRGSGTLSVIDASTLDTTTIDLLEITGTQSEPMYVNQHITSSRVFIGDRLNDRIMVFDAETLAYEEAINLETGTGVFHQWVEPEGKQLWVVGDQSLSVTVIDAESLAILGEVDMSPFISGDGRPHDVFVDGDYAYVSILGNSDGVGLIQRFSTQYPFNADGSVTSGDDPHLFVWRNLLYVVSQGGSTVTAYKTKNLSLKWETEIPNAHGVYVTEKKHLYVTNIAGGGEDAVFRLKAKNGKIKQSVDTPVAVPHNLAVDAQVTQLFVTHSGPTANQVSVVKLKPKSKNKKGGTFTRDEVVTVDVGTNPFGLGLVYS